MDDRPPSGRRSRVSRRQIVEASWVFDSDDNDSSNNDNDNTTEAIDNLESKSAIVLEPEIKPVLVTENIQPHPQAYQNHHVLPIDIRLGRESKSSRDGDCGGSPAVHPLGPSPALFGNVNNFCHIADSSEKDTLDSYMSTRTDDTETNAYTFADSDHFDSSSVASTAYDSRLSMPHYICIVDVLTQTCVFGMSFFIQLKSMYVILTITLIDFCSASSSSSTGSVCTVNGRSNSSPKIIPTRVTNKKALHNELELKFKADLNNSRFTCDDKSLAESSPIISTNGLSELGTTDVKKVRALFETSSSRKSSVGEDSNSSTTSSSGGSSSQRIYSKNPASPTNSNSNTSIVGGVHKKLKQLVNNNNNGHHQTVGKVLRSAYSQFNLSTSGGGGGGRGVDFAELLVNDRVVIEDSPDLFQTLRRSRYTVHFINRFIRSD